ncbi:hypothetical protein AB0395_35110 [Streptosporangium sp. NPDC051023]|uniref:hypothetical protein n=1 Tax=Streptosporangium sp. NPDC051023 TaxID=3155410 RepID=UPI00344E7E74
MTLTPIERTDLQRAFRAVANGGSDFDQARRTAEEMLRILTVDLHIFDEETAGRVLWFASGLVRTLTERGHTPPQIHEAFAVAALRLLDGNF